MDWFTATRRPAGAFQSARLALVASVVSSGAAFAQAPPPSRPATVTNGLARPFGNVRNADQKRSSQQAGETWQDGRRDAARHEVAEPGTARVHLQPFRNQPAGPSATKRLIDVRVRPAAFLQVPEPPATGAEAAAPTLQVAPPAAGIVETLQPPTEPGRVTLPLHIPKPDLQVQITGKGDRISLTARDAPVDQVLALIAQQHGLNVVTAENVKGTVSVTLTNVALDSALDAVLKVNGYTWVRNGDIILVTPISTTATASPSAQGRQVRIFTLNYRAAADVDKIVKGLLSPVGRSVIVESSINDKRRTQDQLIVEDLPEYVERVAITLAQTDVPPRQVLIEAYVLQVALKDDLRHGVDIQKVLDDIDGTGLTLKTQGFVNPNASPAFFLGIEGTDLDVLVEAIKQTTDAKTLASPKVLVVNGQEARIQVGQQLGYFVTTTTQTTTMQQVDFLELGVVLRVTPQITDTGEILMHVKPEVSDGRINAATGLPEEETTEVETTVILPDGHGMIIGGLIKEQDTENQSKIPLVGDLWVVGRLFQRRSVHRERSEIVIALVPRLVSCDAGHPVAPVPDATDADQWARATTRLVGPQLQRVDRRPAEPELPDAIRNPRKLDIHRVPKVWKQVHEPYPYPVDFYFPSADERWMGANLPRPLVYEAPTLYDTGPVWSDPAAGPPPPLSGAPHAPPVHKY